jgi:hypothetical protein
MVKKRSSKLAQSVMRAMRKNGLAKKTGPSTLDVIRAADEGDELGAKHKPPRPYVKSRPDGAEVVYVRDGKNRESLNVAIRKGMTKKQILLAVDIELEKYNERRDDEYLEEKAPEDLTCKQIYARWADSHRATSSIQTNYLHDLYGRHLFDHRPDMRYGDLEDDFGSRYVAYRVAGLAPGRKKDSQTAYAIDHLENFANALELFFRGVAVDKIRRFTMPEFERKKYAFYLPFDWLMRLLLIARGWAWDKENGRWKLRWDLRRGRWVLDYDRGRRDEALMRFIMFYAFSGTRDFTIPALTWGVGLEGGTVDAANLIIVRKPPGHERTNKRAEPADLIGPLRDLVPRWEFKDKLLLTANVIHDAAGKRINDLRKRFDAVADAAGLPWVTPHHCKHTGATLYTYAGVDRYDLADAFSTEADTLKKNYVHLQVRWRDRTKKNVDPKTVTLLSLRHLLPKSNEEWLKGAARLKEDYERRERAKLQKAAGSAASRDGEGVAA